MNGSSASDIHRINILTSYILCHILHIFLCILNWKDTHDNTCKTTAMNSAIDASGVKDAVSDALLAHTWDIANATGISSAQVQTCIENLDIKDWQVADLPANAVPASTVSGSAAGVPATLTTYNNPGYVTISAYGQSIDLAVPAAAQQYLPLIACANQ